MKNNITTYFNNNQKDYTYNNYSNLHLNNQTAIQCLFNGSRFNNCKMIASDFSRSDFVGMLNTNLCVENTRFQNADIKSNVWTNCVFRDCDFSNAYFTDNEYKNCLFINCVFYGSVALNNVFDDCILDTSDLSESTFTKNVFNNVSFSNTNLGNCSFYKQILNKCKYSNVSMNIDSLGQVFGITRDNIKEITYIFLGKSLGVITNDNYDELIDIFQKKNWLFEIINLKYNLGMITNFEYINLVAEYFFDKAEYDSVLNVDELDFFTMVVDYLYRNKTLPLYSLIYSYNILCDTIDLYKDTFNIARIKRLLADLQFHINNMFNELLLDYDKEVFASNADEDIEIILHYENSTVIDFSKIINLSNKILNNDSDKKAILKTVKKGTFIEIIVTTIFGVFALKAIIYGVKGILLDILDIKNGVKQLCSKNDLSPEIIVSKNKNKKSIIFKNIESISQNINKETLKECSLISKLIDKVIFK